MDRLSQLLKERLKSRRLWQQALGARVCGLANQVLSGEGRTVSFKAGTLTVSAKNSALLSSLQARQEEIIKKTNQLLEEGVVTKLRYRIG